MRLLHGTDNSLTDKLEKMAEESIRDITDSAKNFVDQNQNMKDFKSG